MPEEKITTGAFVCREMARIVRKKKGVPLAYLEIYGGIVKSMGLIEVDLAELRKEESQSPFPDTPEGFALRCEWLAGKVDEKAEAKAREKQSSEKREEA